MPVSASSVHFYRDLKPTKSLNDWPNIGFYSECPADWLVLITDISGSTKAIEEGRYKDVNLIGASSIIAILNVARENNTDIPYVFGGDGATLLIPPDFFEACLLHLKPLIGRAKTQFQLELRAAFIPYKLLKEQSKPIYISKHKNKANSPAQALLSGAGVAEAERLAKTPGNPYLIHYEKTEAQEKILHGLECRWKPISSHSGEFHCWLVQFTNPNIEERAPLFGDVMTTFQTIYNLQQSPFGAQDLKLSMRPSELAKEIKTKDNAPNFQKAFNLFCKVFTGSLFVALGSQFMGTNWKKYKEDLPNNSDYQKFDNVLRMIVAGTPKQRELMQLFLESERKQGRLVYGLHTCRHAQMTCAVFNRESDHIHFIDGTEGGYAMAAKQLKQQLKTITLP